MRALIFCTLLWPLFVGLVLVFIGADQSLAAGSLQWEGRPWIGCCAAAVVTFVTLFFLSRRNSSELAFGWLFFFGVFCLGLSLAETIYECARSYPWDPYGHTANKILSRFLLVASTFAIGLAHIIAALIRDYLLPRRTTQRSKK